MWNFKTPGIPDSEFERVDEVPITKEEVRTIQISKARLSPGNVVYDVGCGSGSISVEAGIQVEDSGEVHAVDIDPKAIELTKKNLEKFGVSNVKTILGNAKEKIFGAARSKCYIHWWNWWRYTRHSKNFRKKTKTRR